MTSTEITIVMSFYAFSNGNDEVKREFGGKMAQAPEGEGCPRCGAYVYAAEQMLARGRVSTLNRWQSTTTSQNPFRAIICAALSVVHATVL